MIIHSADFIGGAKEFETSRIWSERVNKEFAAQVNLFIDFGIFFFKKKDLIYI
jgi:hypothetical protein